MKMQKSIRNQSIGHARGLGIRGRLFLGFGAILLILFLAISIVLVKITIAENVATQVIKIELPTYDAYLNLHGYVYQVQGALNNWLITHDPKFKTEISTARDSINRVQSKLDDMSTRWTDANEKQWQELKILLNRLKTVETLIDRAPDAAAAIKILTTEYTPIVDKVFDILDGKVNLAGQRKGGLFDIQHQQLNQGTQEIIDNINSIRIIEYLMLLIGFTLSLLIAGITAKRILQPLNSAVTVAKEIAAGERNIEIIVTSNDETGELLTALDTMQHAISDNEEKLKASEANTRELFDNIVKTAKAFSMHSSKVSAGDLTQRITVESNAEMNQLGTDLNLMTENLSTITKQITQACHNMVSTLDEVKHSVDVQSSGASEQASSVNEITASLGEIEKSSLQTIEKAKALGNVAERTREKGQLGLEAVEQSVAGMRSVRDKVQTIAQTILELSHQTQQVGEITAVVNTLAQQSKMLALNASIEAAKAGEAGKGFAVVAIEVKNLAEQSEQSTAQVQKILEDIRHATEKAVMATEEGTKGVDYGTTLVEQTGGIVRSLTDVIHEATIASQQIEAAIRQENVGIEQINAGMNEINQVTASFVESVKQTTEAIGHLSDIAKNLKNYIEIYKI